MDLGGATASAVQLVRRVDGFINQTDWTIFWIGETNFDRIARTVKLISDLPADFAEDNDGG